MIGVPENSAPLKEASENLAGEKKAPAKEPAVSISRGCGVEISMCYADPYPQKKAGAGEGWTPNGAELITLERRRQISVEGYPPEHDDGHDKGELTEAAMCYACVGSAIARGSCAQEWPVSVLDGHADSLIEWPWDEETWKPSNDPIRNLVKAGALIAAEIDRLQRKKAREGVS